MEGGGGGVKAKRRTAVHPVVDLIRAYQRVAARKDGDPRPPIAADHVVLDDALCVVADEDADALAVVDLVVHDVAARVGALRVLEREKKRAGRAGERRS